MNILKTTVVQLHQEENLKLVEFDFSGERIFKLFYQNSIDLEIGDICYLKLLPNEIYLFKEFMIESSFVNQMKVSILSFHMGEIVTLLQVVLNGVVLEIHILTKAFERLNVGIGDSVIIAFSATAPLLKTTKK